ncbi:MULTISPECIES: Na(+)/H(+) antiporter subunit C [unclassified Arthrobacter]|uniref:Na(+)/H(+) antiporter subunit C n=1 Tax=unclassified Arthrobacter TaxID=235627 RepID=UPI002E08634D|nr:MULTISPECIES: Na(+)/H(+) antiporter subunit C [unclassified Arthrobacter]MEC5192231.1 multicomponent Na+:H+ antiporter subunit C [Arthrobacter sp. MP_M4]MEC5203727.1 multicomponent Na+:H+ antiporter subunit C [Arthrobacter sp. MP_M7]
MSVNLTLLMVMGALYACGIYLLLERSLTRVLLGLMLLTNATNLLILTTGGYAGLAPMFSKDTPAAAYNDPLPQALILTSIVISFAVTAFMLGIIYRTWVLAREDEIQDDAEDRRVARTPSFDIEDDSVVPVETSEFPLTMIGTDGQAVSDIPAGASAIVEVADRTLDAHAAAAEEQPGSLNVIPPNKEGGGQ